MYNGVYKKIISEYLNAAERGEKPSISKIAKTLEVSEEKVRRTLITEGIWTSKTAKQVTDLYHQGMTVSEIAHKLVMSEKNVQSYIPYSRGMYGGDASPDAIRSGEYRKRMKHAAKQMHSRNSKGEVMKDNIKSGDENISEQLDAVERENTYEKDKQRRFIELRKETEAQYTKLSSLRADDYLEIARKKRLHTRSVNKLYQLRFDLISNPTFNHYDDELGMNEAERKDFLRLAKAEKGISRTAIVPGDMNLHALHYMIQKMFGWQNSHLHMFSLSENDFKSVTACRIGEWEKLCGSIFRFPGADVADIYWDDDYEEGISPKTWLKRKYSAPYQAKCVSESFLYNLQEVAEFEKYFGENGERIKFSKDALIDEILHRVNFEEYTMNILAERLCVKDLFVKAKEEDSAIPDERLQIWHSYMIGERELAIKEWDDMQKKYPNIAKELMDNMKQLITWRHNRNSCDEAIRYGHEDWVKKQIGITPGQLLKQSEYRIPDLEEKCFSLLDNYNPRCYPLFGTVLYNYDYGDDWIVRITCEEIYIRKDEWDFPDQYGYVRVSTFNEKDGLTTYRYFDTSGEEAAEERRTVLAEIDVKKRPICIDMDGPMLLDDVGGIHGFHDMLKVLKDPDADTSEEERRDMKVWAKGMGWTGRTPKPENLL